MKILAALAACAIALGLTATCAHALDMDSAVQAALGNSHTIKKQESLLKSKQSAVLEARAPLYPMVRADYAFIQSTESAFGPDKSTSSLTLKASYNLFSGGASVNALSAASESRDAYSYLLKSARADVILDAKSAYIGVLRARRNYMTASEAVELLDRQAAESELYYREGLIAKNDLLKVQVELSSARQDQLEAEGVLRNAVYSLESLTSLSINLEEVINGSGLTDFTALPAPLALDFETLRQEMLNARSEIKYLKSIQQSYAFSADATSGTRLPRVDASLSFSTYGDSIVPFGGGAAYDTEGRLMLTAGMPIFESGSTRHTEDGLRSLAESASEDVLETGNALELQLHGALESYRIAEGKLKVTSAGVSQAEENYRVTENQFRERVATTTDLIDARSYLTRARNQHNNALYDLYLSEANMQRVLERGGR